MFEAKKNESITFETDIIVMLDKLIFFFLFFTTSIFALGLSLYNESSDPDYKIVEEGRKKGLEDKNGKLIIPIKFDDLGWTHGEPEPYNDIIGYQENGFWGLINLNNKKLTPPLYSHLSPGNGHIIASRKGIFSHKSFFGVLDLQGKNIVPFNYDYLENANGNLIGIYKNRLNFYYGIIDTNNQIIVPFKYKEIKYLTTHNYMVKKEDLKNALYDNNGNQLTKFQYDSLVAVNDRFIQVYDDGKTGLIDNAGKSIVDTKYKMLEFDNEISAVGLLISQWELLDTENKFHKYFYYDEIESVNNRTIKAKLKNSEYLINIKDGKVLSPPTNSIGQFKNAITAFDYLGKYGLINDRGKVILKAKFDTIYTNAGLAHVAKIINSKRKWSLYDSFGIKKTFFLYDETRAYHNKLFAVKRNSHWGFINRRGEEVIQCVYDKVGKFKSDKVEVVFHNEYGIINNKGKWSIGPQKNKVKLIDEDLYSVYDYRQTLIMDFNGNLVYFTENPIEFINGIFKESIDDSTFLLINKSGVIIQYTNTNSDYPKIYDNYYIISKEGKLGSVDHSGNVIIELNEIYQELFPPSEGYWGVKIDGGYGFIDFNQKLRIANRYEQISRFNEGLAAVMLRGKWGFVDKYENLIIQPLYQQASDFKNGISIVRKNNGYGIINQKGEYIQKPDFEKITQTNSGNFKVWKKYKVGLLNSKGAQIISPKYDTVEEVSNSYLIISREDKYGVIDYHGVSSIPMIYNDLIYDQYNKLFIGKKTGDWVDLNLTISD